MEDIKTQITDSKRDVTVIAGTGNNGVVLTMLGPFTEETIELDEEHAYTLADTILQILDGVYDGPAYCMGDHDAQVS